MWWVWDKEAYTGGPLRTLSRARRVVKHWHLLSEIMFRPAH